MASILNTPSPGPSDSVALDDTGNGIDSANGPTNPKDKSSITTMKPYKPSFRKERRRYKLDSTLVHFEHIFGIDNWSRFPVLKTEGRIAPSFLENKLLSLCPTREMSFRAQKTNEWLIEATTKKQSDKFLNIEEINGVKVNVKSHDMLNYVQGTVVLPQMIDETELPEKHIRLESLKLRYSNVHDLDVYEISSRKDPNNIYPQNCKNQIHRTRSANENKNTWSE